MWLLIQIRQMFIDRLVQRHGEAGLGKKTIPVKDKTAWTKEKQQTAKLSIMSEPQQHLAGGQQSEAKERMGRAELLGGNMSTQDPSELWGQSDGGADLLQDLGAKDSVKHFHVEYTGYSFKFGFNEYSTLKDFVKHFANQPLIGSETGKGAHPAFGQISRQAKTEVNLGTKEGYLTKQGGLVKTWKTRWFTLQRNELKYFKDQMVRKTSSAPRSPFVISSSPEPIRILDLRECSAVQFDYSQERVNCFCLVFPFRTFYLCAKTGVEADEWIKILRWKLDQSPRLKEKLR
ncbi:hypothetical protein A6R68_00858 [Neotoma lepida]|uniref:PH domain-containing protein n=1 Tax=Neotoma lepida TaxID=56216 RepID=A0A1A6GXB2_NEOLE|nr:hypothetical protein A6R68_00858 [Neotoma lepida]